MNRSRILFIILLLLGAQQSPAQVMVWEPASGFPLRPASILNLLPEGNAVREDGTALFLYTVSSQDTLYLRAQVLDPFGEKQWGEEGVSVTSNLYYKQAKVIPFPDGSWGVAFGSSYRSYQAFSTDGDHALPMSIGLSVEDAPWYNRFLGTLDVWPTEANTFIIAFEIQTASGTKALQFQSYSRLGGYQWAISDSTLDPGTTHWTHDKAGNLFLALERTAPPQAGTLFRKYDSEGENVWGNENVENGILFADYTVELIAPDLSGGLLSLGEYEALQQFVHVPSWSVDEESITHRTPVHGNPSIEIHHIYPINSTIALLEGTPYPLGGDETTLLYPFYKVRYEREVWVNAWSHPYLRGSYLDEDEDPTYRFLNDGEGGAWVVWRDGGETTSMLSHMESNGSHGSAHLELPIHFTNQDGLGSTTDQLTVAWEQSDTTLKRLNYQQIDLNEMAWVGEPGEFATGRSGQVETLASCVDQDRFFTAWVEMNAHEAGPFLTAQDKLEGTLLFDQPYLLARRQEYDPTVDSWWKMQLFPLTDGLLAVWSKRWVVGNEFGYRVTVQKVSAAGERLWGDEGVVILEEISSRLHTPKVFSLNELDDGAVVLMLSSYLAGDDLTPLRRSIIESHGTIRQMAEEIQLGEGFYLVLGAADDENGRWTIYSRTAGGQNHHLIATHLRPDGLPEQEGSTTLFSYFHGEERIQSFARVHGRNLIVKSRELGQFGPTAVEAVDVTSCEPVLTNEWVQLDTLEEYYTAESASLIESYDGTFWMVVTLDNNQPLRVARYAMNGDQRTEDLTFELNVSGMGDLLSDGAGGLHILSAYGYNGGTNWMHWDVHGWPATEGFENNFGAQMRGLSQLRYSEQFHLDGAGGVLCSWIDHRATAQGIYTMRLSDFTALATPEPHADTPTHWLLHPPAPNPFNPSTTITVDIGSSGWMTLAVYDLLGREVTRLHEGRMAVGQRRFHWDGHSSSGIPVTSGLYFFRLETAEGFQVRKAVLLK